jgi:hypothetical protein
MSLSMLPNLFLELFYLRQQRFAETRIIVPTEASAKAGLIIFIVRVSVSSFFDFEFVYSNLLNLAPESSNP